MIFQLQRSSQLAASRTIFLGSSLLRNGTRQWFHATLLPHLPAATAAQKRALNEKQLLNNDASSTVEGASPAAGAPPPSGGSGNSTQMYAGAAVATVAIGAGSYWYMSSNKKVQDSPPMEEPVVVSKEEAEPKVIPESTDTDDDDDDDDQKYASDGHVVRIGIPLTMRNRSNTQQVKVLKHPTGGNRVSLAMAPAAAPAETKTVISEEEKNDTSFTDRALQLLRGSKLAERESVLLHAHRDVLRQHDSSLFDDLDSLSVPQLKARVIQLATEMKDRTSWEALRLKEFLALKEKETSDQ
jgi:hypothetical protein